MSWLLVFMIALPVGVQRGGASEKDSRTPAQRKINSQLLYEIYRRRGEAVAVPYLPGRSTSGLMASAQLGRDSR